MLSRTALAVAFASAAWIALDIYARHYRQPMKVVEAVWPVTALYFVRAGRRRLRCLGRPASGRWQGEHGDPPPKPGYTVTATGVSHCRVHARDITAEFAVVGLGASVAGLTIGAEYIGDYVAAIIIIKEAM